MNRDPIEQAIKLEVSQELRGNPRVQRAFRTFTWDLDCGTGHQGEVDAEIRYVYEPAEPRAWDYPGCPAWVEILSIRAGKIDLMELLGKAVVSAIEDDIKGPE